MKQAKEIQNRFVGVKMTPTLYGAAARKAKRTGKTLSAVIRDAVAKDVKASEVRG